MMHRLLPIAWLLGPVLLLIALGARLAAQQDADAPAPTAKKPAAEAPLVEIINDEPESESPEAPAVKDSASLATLAASLTIFVLAIFVGFEVITKVPPTLHTPLMSGSNAISGITIVGAILVTGLTAGFPAFVGMLAVALAAVNVVGGFLVTHRMLSMFRRK